MKHLRFAYVLALLTFVPAAGCGGGAGDDDPDPPADSNNEPAVCDAANPEDRVLAVFSATCGTSSCHDASFPAGGLDLASPDVEARLLGVNARCGGTPLVVAGDPDSSFLISKITQPTCGSRMPIGPPLSGADVACFEEWVAGLSAVAPADLHGGEYLDDEYLDDEYLDADHE